MANTFAIPGPSGLTVTMTIKRQADDYFWTGSVWQAGSATVAMTWDSDLELYLSTTEPDARCFYSAASSTGILLGYGEYDPYSGAAATASAIAPTIANLKAYLQITDTSDDTFLTSCTNRAGEFVEQFTHRRFASSSRTYVVDGSGTERLYLPDWPVTTVTSIYGPCYHAPRHMTATGGSVSASELVDGDYYVIGNIGLRDEAKDHILRINSDVWGAGNQNFQVIATTGYSTIPSDLYQASIEVAATMYNTGHHGTLGKTALSTDGGSSAYELEKGMPSGTLDTLKRYRRWSF